MNLALYFVALALVKFLQALPLTLVARIGRMGGALFYLLDRRHRRVAIANLTAAFDSNSSPSQTRALARENFKRIGEAYCCAIKTAAMSWEQLQPHCRFVGVEKILAHSRNQQRPNIVVAVGHFGNFELYARFGHVLPAYTGASTYRGLRQPALNQLLLKLRQQSGCRFFERRSESAALKKLMNEQGVILGLLSDQHAGHAGAQIPFLGRACSASTAAAVFALRYRCPLHTSICFRTGLAQWQIEAGDEIPTRSNGQPRATEEITLDINRAFEIAVRRDPANWFWVHNRWKSLRNKPHRRQPDSRPAGPAETGTRAKP